MISNIPTENHWAILTEVSVTIPGDERSKTNPGHGYPATTEVYINYESFKTEPEWRKQIESYTRFGKNFRAIVVYPAKVETKITIDYPTSFR